MFPLRGGKILRKILPTIVHPNVRPASPEEVASLTDDVDLASLSATDGLSLQDGGTPIGPAHLTALINLLRDAVVESGLERRNDEAAAKRIVTLVSAINDAGIDGEALLRYGMTFETIVPISVELAFDATNGVEAVHSEWFDVLGISAVQQPPLNRKDFVAAVNAAISKTIPQLLKWVYYAPFADIVNLSVPSVDVLRSAGENPPPQQVVCDQYRWIVDRLSGKSPRQWQTASLELEYQWRRGDEVASLPTAALVDIEVETDVIAIQIADRKVSRKGAGESEPLGSQVKEKAKEFLRQRRYSDAAALFEFMGDYANLPKAGCLNDRGFCWIPEDPKRAMYFLEQAASKKYSPRSVNVYNQMCCKLILGELTGVRLIAEYYWAREFENHFVDATLWRRDGDQWRLEEATDAREFIAELALAAAESEGWPERIVRWTKRLEALRKGEYFV